MSKFDKLIVEVISEATTSIPKTLLKKLQKKGWTLGKEKDTLEKKVRSVYFWLKIETDPETGLIKITLDDENQRTGMSHQISEGGLKEEDVPGLIKELVSDAEF